MAEAVRPAAAVGSGRVRVGGQRVGESGPVIYRLQWCECGHVSETFPRPQTPFITAPRLSGHNFSPLGGVAVVINAGHAGNFALHQALPEFGEAGGGDGRLCTRP